MRKILKTLIVVGGGLIILLVSIGLFLPSKSTVMGMTTINQPIDQVYNVVNDLGQFQNWSPFTEFDEYVTYEYSDQTSGVGAKMYWQSRSKEISSGSLHIIKSIVSESVRSQVIINRKWLGTMRFDLSADELVDNETRLIWRFEVDWGSNIIARYYGLTFESKLQSYFNNGVQRLKLFIEQGN